MEGVSSGNSMARGVVGWFAEGGMSESRGGAGGLVGLTVVGLAEGDVA